MAFKEGRTLAEDVLIVDFKDRAYYMRVHKPRWR